MSRRSRLLERCHRSWLWAECRTDQRTRSYKKRTFCLGTKTRWPPTSMIL
uniref:Uncharacterized protein n=1 Tax=Anguilla anguilla TaxID=7936 RepID=A0A0E9PC21_ANGAN